MIHLNSLLELEPIEEFEMVEDSAYQDDIEWLRETNLKDKRIRQVLAAFTGILVIAAPVISALYPSTWTLILSTALAFTIGTNLLISVVTVKVESKAQKLEEKALEEEHTRLNQLRKELTAEFGKDLWEKSLEKQRGKGTTEDLYWWYKKQVKMGQTPSEMAISVGRKTTKGLQPNI